MRAFLLSLLFLTLPQCKEVVESKSAGISEEHCRTRRDGSFWNGSSCIVAADKPSEEALCQSDSYARWNGETNTCNWPQDDAACAALSPDLVFNGKSCDFASAPANFYRLCIDSSIKADAKKTIDAIRAPYLTSSCAAVYQQLLMSDELNLNSTGIAALSPIGSLTHLRKLELRNNQISDPRALASLVALETLDIGRNLLTDISFTASLTKLKWLSVAENQIKSASPLEGLELDYLDVSRNLISDLTHLKSKKFRLGFYFQGNP